MKAELFSSRNRQGREESSGRIQQEKRGIDGDGTMTAARTSQLLTPAVNQGSSNSTHELPTYGRVLIEELV